MHHNSLEVWFRSFSFLFMGDGCRFQPLIFQGVITMGINYPVVFQKNPLVIPSRCFGVSEFGPPWKRPFNRRLEVWGSKEVQTFRHRSIREAGMTGIPEAEIGLKPQKPLTKNWLVVSNILCFHPYLGKWSTLTNIFQVGWNHQLEKSGEIFGSLWLDLATQHYDIKCRYTPQILNI